jgi:hypothetical protein
MTTRSKTKESDTVNRREFVKRWMIECGVTYDVACQIYRSMVSTFEEGVANGHKITIGRLGALLPQWQESRQVTMGFRRTPGKGVVKQKQVYTLDPRYRFRFKIYKEWMSTRHLNWYE